MSPCPVCEEASLDWRIRMLVAVRALPRCRRCGSRLRQARGGSAGALTGLAYGAILFGFGLSALWLSYAPIGIGIAIAIVAELLIDVVGDETDALTARRLRAESRTG